MTGMLVLSVRRCSRPCRGCCVRGAVRGCRLGGALWEAQSVRCSQGVQYGRHSLGGAV